MKTCLNFDILDQGGNVVVGHDRRASGGRLLSHHSQGIIESRHVGMFDVIFETVKIFVALATFANSALVRLGTETVAILR